MDTKTKVILAFVAIFLTGFFSGYLVSSTYGGQNETYIERRGERGQHMRGENRSLHSERAHERAANRLAEYLELTETQQDEFFRKMREYRVGLREVIREMRGRESDTMRQQYLMFRNDMGSVLAGDQLEKLDVFLHPDSVRVRQNRPSRQR